MPNEHGIYSFNVTVGLSGQKKVGCREGLGIRVCQKLSLPFVPLPTGRLHSTGSEAGALFFSKPARKKAISVIPAERANQPSKGTVRNSCLICGKSTEATHAACKPLFQWKCEGLNKWELERQNLVLSKYCCLTYFFSNPKEHRFQSCVIRT